MTDRVPLVTVVIPTYNRAHFVTKAIDSVLSQTFADYEIIVVDDGSTDATRKNLKKYGDRIRYIYQDNAGVSAARNTGVKVAIGKWVAFLDSDDEWRVNYLSKQIEYASMRPGICMQATNCLFIALNGETKSYYDINGAQDEFSGMDYLFVKNPFIFVITHGPWQVGSTIILRDAITKVGLFDTSVSLSEDFDLMARVARQGPFGMIRDELVNIYRREESVECLTNQVKKNPIHARESDERIYEKLKTTGQLRYRERRELNRLLSANRRAIGNLFLKAGNVKSARDSYKRALLIYSSIASLCSYMLSFLPMSAIQWINEKRTFLKR